MTNQEPGFIITDAKLYVQVVTLSTQDNVKFIQQLQSSFQRTINWNKSKSKTTTQARNQYFTCLDDSNFEEVNRLFALSYIDIGHGTSWKRYFLLIVERNDSNVMIDR